MQLRDYQFDCLEYLDSFDGDRLCVAAPTGAGKSLIMSYYAANELYKGNKTLLLVHRKELLEQTRKIFVKQFNYHPTLIIAGQKTVFQENQSIYLGMVETVFRRRDLLKELNENIDVLINDESHLASFFKLLEGFKKVVGFTATPQIVKKEDCLKNYYKTLYEVTTVPKLLEQGFLVPPATYAPIELVKKAKKMDLSTSMGDYRESDQEREINEVFADVIDSIKKYKRGRTLIFHPTVALSKKVSHVLNSLGFESYHLDGETKDDEREFIKRRLDEGSEVTVNNCGVLTTGFDEPKIETVVLNRLTKSENLLIQMVGRGSRLAKDKTNFILLDLFGNTIRLGLWQAERDWQARFTKIKKTKEGEAPVKSCPKCDSVVPIQCKKCPECGHDFEAEEKQARLKVSQELALMQEASIKEKAALVMEEIRERGYKPFAALYRIARYIKQKSKNKTDEQVEAELMIALQAWCEENKDNSKIRFNRWYKEKIVEIYKSLKE
jgi:superfamily II DNA or RNA helicase